MSLSHFFLCYGILSMSILAETPDPSATTPESQVEDHYEQGKRLYEMGKYKEAIESYTKSLAVQPDAVTFFARGVAWSELGNNANAVLDAGRAISLDQTFATAYVFRASCRTDIDDCKGALADFSKAIELVPDQADLHFARAGALISLEKYKQALVDLDTAIGLEPENSNGYVARAICRRSARMSDSAKEDINRAIALNPSCVVAHLFLGTLEEDAGHFARAYKSYSQAVKLDNNSDSANCALALLLATCPEEDIQDRTRALQLAETACKRTDWKNWKCLATLATVNAVMGNVADAAKWQTKALGLAPKEHRQDVEKRLKAYQARTPSEQRTE